MDPPYKSGLSHAVNAWWAQKMTEKRCLSFQNGSQSDCPDAADSAMKSVMKSAESPQLEPF